MSQASEDQVFDASLDWLEADMIRRAEENNALHTLQISANQLLEHIRFPCLSSTKLKHLSRLFDNAPSLSSSSASTLENTTKPISQIEVEDLLKGEQSQSFSVIVSSLNLRFEDKSTNTFYFSFVIINTSIS